MDPFLRAREDMARTPIARDAMYQYRTGGPPFPVRVIPSAPENREGSAFGQGAGKSGIRVEMTIVASVFLPSGPDGQSRPQKGDTLGFGSARGYRVETVRQDERGTAFTLGLSRQD